MGVVDGRDWLKARTRHLEDELARASSDVERDRIGAELERLRAEHRRSWLARLLPFVHG